MKDYIFINQDINILKDEVKSSKDGVFSVLLINVIHIFDVELPVTHPKLSTTYMGIAMANLSLAHILTDDKKILIRS